MVLNNDLKTSESLVDSFLNTYYAEQKPVILYGAGSAVVSFIKFMKDRDIEIACIIDKNQFGEMEGIPIKPIQEVKDVLEDAYVVISAISHRKEIIETLPRNIKVFAFDPTLDILQMENSAFRKEYYIDHWNEISSLYDLLDDDVSKNTLIKVLEGAITNSCDCYKSISCTTQYFHDFILDSLSEDEVFVDIGAYDGDSIEEFINVTKNKFKKIIAYEPHKDNIEKARNRFKDERILFFQYGIGDKKCMLHVVTEDNNTVDDKAFLTDKADGNNLIRVMPLDELIQERVTLVKMDIEGMEKEAIKGGWMTISKYHPKLAISVYHKTEDLVEIPRLILDINPEYRLYLRHYWDSCGTDTILFAI